MVQLAATLIVINYAPLILMLGLVLIAAPFALLARICESFTREDPDAEYQWAFDEKRGHWLQYPRVPAPSALSRSIGQAIERDQRRRARQGLIPSSSSSR